MADIYDYIKRFAKIDLEFQAQSGKFYSLRSYIKSINDNSILIESPYDQSKVYVLPIGQELGIGVHSKSGILIGQSYVLGKELLGVSGILISYPTNIQYIQRREYVRVPLNLETEIIIKDRTSEKDYVKRVRLRDISGSGISYESKDQMTPYYDIKCKIFMDDGEEPIYSSLKHVYSRKNIINNDTKYIHAFSFIGLEQRNIDRIVKVSFKYQLELKKRI